MVPPFEAEVNDFLTFPATALLYPTTAVLHGIGLKSVKHIVKQYDGEIIINTDDNVFKVKIMIPM
ncbi:MAG: ATP-binding protein [Ruminococcus sp.]|nr:ATP-binding protein [Ruminococcus sp.]